MSDKIVKLAESFKDIAELQAYCDSQYKTIIELSKKINKLEEQNRHLEQDLQKNGVKSTQSSLVVAQTISDEELICLTQIKLLKDISDRGALTLEETRKYDIFVKSLKDIRSASKDSSKKLESLDDAELLALIEKK